MLFEVEIVTVELHGGLHEAGLNEQDAPDGKPEQLRRLTGSVEPLVKLKFIMVVVEPPAVTIPVVGLNEPEYSNVSFCA